MLLGKVKAPEYFRAAVRRVGSMPMEGLMPDSVINSRKGSLVYLAIGQTAYGPCHLVHPLTTLASIYKVRKLYPKCHTKKKRSQGRKMCNSLMLNIYKKV